MCYGKAIETKCPNPKCSAVYERIDYSINPPPIPMIPSSDWYRAGAGDERVGECDHCGVELESAFAAIAAYREAREVFTVAADKADAAWMRWFTKRQAGVAANGAQAARLANQANYASADLATAESKVWAHEIDPRDVCVADGVDPAKFPATA